MVPTMLRSYCNDSYPSSLNLWPLFNHFCTNAYDPSYIGCIMMCIQIDASHRIVCTVAHVEHTQQGFVFYSFTQTHPCSEMSEACIVITGMRELSSCPAFPPSGRAYLPPRLGQMWCDVGGWTGGWILCEHRPPKHPEISHFGVPEGSRVVPGGPGGVLRGAASEAKGRKP